MFHFDKPPDLLSNMFETILTMPFNYILLLIPLNINVKFQNKLRRVVQAGQANP